MLDLLDKQGAFYYYKVILDSSRNSICKSAVSIHLNWHGQLNDNPHNNCLWRNFKLKPCSHCPSSGHGTARWKETDILIM